MERGLARPVATLKLGPAEISKRLGLSFETTRDDLDELEAAVFRDTTGQQFALVRHRHQPNPGTDILINENLRDLSAALRDALRALRLEPKDLQWTSPKANVTKSALVARSPVFTLTSATLRKAAEIQEQIERLESKRDQALRRGQAPSPDTHQASARVAQNPSRRSRGSRPSFPVTALAPAVVHVLRSRGKPMGVSDILNELIANGYKFHSASQKRDLRNRIYRLKGVRRVGTSKFVAD